MNIYLYTIDSTTTWSFLIKVLEIDFLRLEGGGKERGYFIQLI